MPRKHSAVKVRLVTQVVTQARDIVVIVPLSRLSDDTTRERLLKHLGAVFPDYRFSLSSLTPFEDDDIAIIPVLASISEGDEPTFERPSEDLLDAVSTTIATFLKQR
jgi:hypothetical protein